MATSIAAINGTGQVFAVNAQGVQRSVKVGDVLQKGETIRTVGDVQVELLMDDGRLMAVAPNQVLRLDENVTESDQRPTAQDSAVGAPAATADTVLQALERGTDLSTELEATAAGLGGGGGADGGSSFVQLLRIVEGVEPLAYEYSYTAPDLPPDLQSNPETLTTTTMVLTADPVVLEGSPGVTYTVTLGDPATTDMTVTLNNGAVIVIPAGSTTGSVLVPVQGDDVYKDGETLQAAIDTVQGGGFTSITVDDSNVITVVNDTIDTTPVSVGVSVVGGEGDVNNVIEGNQLTFRFSVNQAPQTDLILNVTVGGVEQTVTIAAGTLFADVTVDSRADENYVQGATTVTGTVNSVSLTADGNFENLSIEGAGATATVVDDGDVTSATLTSAMTGNEDGATVTYTMTLGTAPTVAETFTFMVGEVEKTITVAAGDTTGTTTVSVSEPDVFVDSDTIAAPTGLAGSNNSNYEQLNLANNSTSHVVGDSIDTTTLTLNNVTVSEADAGAATITGSLDHTPQTELVVTLSNGATITFGASYTPGTEVSSTEFNATSGNISVASTSGGNYEDLDTTDTATVTVIDNALVVGSNVNDTSPQTVDHQVDTSQNAPDGSIDGDISNDVLIGDVGGIGLSTLAYHLTLIVDVSGSISSSELGQMKTALDGLLQNFTGAQVDLICFAKTAATATTYTINSGTDISSLLTVVGNRAGLDTGGTNYGDAFDKAQTSLATYLNNPASNGVKCLTYFISDGEPQTGTVQDLSAAQSNSDLAYLQSHSDVSAVGIGVGTNATAQGILNFIHEDGDAIYSDFGTIGDDISQLLQTVSPVGDDVINGGDGNDVILGDSIYSTSADKGWADYVETHSGLTTDEARLIDIYTNLTSANPTYAREGTVGGDDVIHGGDGGDVIFGQAGSDQLYGDAGNDILVGGSDNSVTSITPAQAQVTKITFASSYDVGDVVSMTVNGTTYSHTVAAGATSAENVYDALKAVSVGGVALSSSLTSQGVTWASDLTSNAVTLSGNAGLDGAFTIASSTNNDNDVGTATYRIDFRSTSGIAFDNNDTVSVVINGVTYTSDGSNAGNNEGAYYDDAVTSLQSALSTAGFSISNVNTSNDHFDVSGPITSAGSALVTLDGTADSTSTVSLQSSSTASNQSAPSVETTQNAADASSVSVSQYGDTLVGGAGDDTLTGGAGADVFKWSLGDQGSSGTPAIDHITDFSKAEGDTLNLADLLQGHGSDLTQHLTFGSDGTNAVLSISTTGDVTQPDQQIVFDNRSLVQLESDFGAASTTDLLTKMIANGNLKTDV